MYEILTEGENDAVCSGPFSPCSLLLINKDKCWQYKCFMNFPKKCEEAWHLENTDFHLQSSCSKVTKNAMAMWVFKHIWLSQRETYETVVDCNISPHTYVTFLTQCQDFVVGRIVLSYCRCYDMNFLRMGPHLLERLTYSIHLSTFFAHFIHIHSL